MEVQHRSQGASGAKYALTGPLQWRCLGEEWVVYATATGALRQVDLSDSCVLMALEQGPCDLPSLLASLEQALQVRCDEQHRQGLLDLLQELGDLGLVTTHP